MFSEQKMVIRTSAVDVGGGSPPASQSGELETRFAMLLEPIRDLAKNWDIDVAHHLEDYLAEVPLSLSHYYNRP